jgi:hypothetical protein
LPARAASPVRARCIPRNTDKDARPIEEFLAGKPALLARIKAQARAPLNDATAVNAMRRALSAALADSGLPLAASSGGRTKFNRSRLGIPNTHALEAACVGEVGALVGWQHPTFAIKASARRDYCRTKLTAHGLPRGYRVRTMSVRGFQTGDMARAKVRVAVRGSGSFGVGNAGAINMGDSDD